MDRMATCPRCGNPVRLTTAELIDKRGTCFICDESFDVTVADLRAGDAPYRQAPEAIEVHRSPLVLPGVVEDVDAGRLRLTSQRTSAAGLMGGAMLLPLLVMGWAFTRMPGHMASFPFVFLLAVIGVFLGRGGYRMLAGWDELQFAGDKLSIVRRTLTGMHTHADLLAHVREVYVAERNDGFGRQRGERHVQVVFADGTIVKVGEHLGLDEHVLQRIKEWVEERRKQPRPALPAP